MPRPTAPLHGSPPWLPSPPPLTPAYFLPAASASFLARFSSKALASRSRRCSGVSPSLSFCVLPPAFCARAWALALSMSLLLPRDMLVPVSRTSSPDRLFELLPEINHVALPRRLVVFPNACVALRINTWSQSLPPSGVYVLFLQSALCFDRFVRLFVFLAVGCLGCLGLTRALLTAALLLLGGHVPSHEGREVSPGHVPNADMHGLGIPLRPVLHRVGKGVDGWGELDGLVGLRIIQAELSGGLLLLLEPDVVYVVVLLLRVLECLWPGPHVH
mmetsp:Transcript_11064/g.30925  ORF Transcript_11064/g.30925 Transcript_11064/m.30925 type:complete len:274 (-) Transcript_11064:2263-3084(-)